MQRYLFLLFTLVFGVAFTTAQNVSIKEESGVAQMMEHFTNVNKSKEYVEGWRVQVLTTTDRQVLERERSNFAYRYPSITSNWQHSKPYFQLRAGAFRTKLETLRLLYILRRDYPRALLVKDQNIRPQELVDAAY